ncbi:MAG: hypothetical protein ACO1RA_10690 [Planctomycetaceae bacterium]
MQGRLANSFNALERQKRRQLFWHRFHSLVVAIGVCLLMLLAVVRRPQGYVAVVALQGEGEGSSPALVEAWLRSPDVVQTAMHNCLVGAGKSRITSVGTHEDLATFRQRFQVVANSQAHESPYLEVEFTASTPSQALRGAAEIGLLVEEDFERSQQAKRIAAFDTLLRELTQRNQQIQTARQDSMHLMERLRHEQLAATMLLAQQPASTEVRGKENLRWKQMREELNQLLITRMQLVAKFLPSHPQVEQIDLQITGLREQLRAIPQSEGDGPQGGFGKVLDSTKATNLRQVTHREQKDPESAASRGAKVLDRLETEIDDLQLKLAALGKQERQVHLEIDTLRRGAVAQVSNCVWSSGSPRLVKQVAGQPLVAGQLWGILAISCCAGLAFLFLAKGNTNAQVMWNLPEVQASLKLPAIGVVARSHSSPELNVQGNWMNRRFSSWPVLSAYGLVGFAMVALVATFSLQPAHFAMLQQYPLETVVQAIAIWIPGL